MKKILFLLLCVIVSLVNTPTVYPQDDSSCPGAPPTRLIAGERGRVTSGPANNVRADPTTTSTVLEQLAGGSFFLVLDGPVCADGFAWWQIESGDLIGWTAEGQDESYWLEPLHTITPENAAQVRQVATLGLDGELLGWSPDGQTLAILTGGGVKLVDYDHFGALPIREFDTDREVDIAVFSPDWSLLATASRFYSNPSFEYTTPRDYSIRVWNIATGELVQVLDEPTQPVSHLSFSPDSRLLLAGDRYYDAIPIFVWEVATGQPLPVPEDYRLVKGFDSNNNLYVLDLEGSLWLWDVYRGQMVSTTPILEAGDISDYVITSDQTRVITGTQVWDLTTGTRLYEFNAGYNVVDTERGLLVTSEYPNLKVYSLHTGNEIATLQIENSEDGIPLMFGGLGEITFSDDGRFMASHDATEFCVGSLGVWDLQTEDMVFWQNTGCASSMLFLPNSHNLLFTSMNNGVQVWDAEAGNVEILTNNAPVFMHVWFNERLLAASDDSWPTPIIHVWDATNWTELESITNGSAVLALSPDGRLVAYAGWNEEDLYNNERSSNGTVHLWESFRGEEIVALQADEGSQLQHLVFNADGTVVAAVGTDGAQEQQVWAWDVTTGEQQETIDSVLQDQLLHLASIPEWQEPYPYNWILGTPYHSPVSPDGLLMASPCTWGTEGLCLLDMSSQEIVRELESVQGYITHAAFSPDGRLVAAVTGDPSYYQNYDSEGQLYIWDVATGELLAEPKGHVRSGWGVAFSLDGTLIASAGGGCWACEGWGGWDSAVRIWAVP